ncbi:MAG: hypothetical protein JHC84_05215 [Solirubrobacteraceae bacterium]|nr:hypothetical protein [Solirubrobacteraceae bacterium]
MSAAVLAAAPASGASPVSAPPPDLAATVPGEILRAEPASARLLPGSPRAWRLLYRSTSADGSPIAVSGSVIVPPGARHVLAIAPSTQGFADRCAPSRRLQDLTLTELPMIAAATARGWAVAMTDYEGLGTPGQHTMFVGRSEGHAVLDALRAARALPGSGLTEGGRSGVLGYSQGGAAAAWTAQLQPTYAPDVPLAGVAAGGTIADLPAFLAAGSGTWGAGAGFGTLLGLDAAYDDLDLAPLLTPRGESFARTVGSRCALEWIATLNYPRASALLASDPFVRPAWARRAHENTPGDTAPAAPVLLYHGRGDRSVPIAGAERLRAAWCTRGATVRWRAMATDHAGALVNGTTSALSWLGSRMSGTQPEPGTCG